MPLRQSAREMRDLYANEIARAIHQGLQPEQFSIDSWARYEAEATLPMPAVRERT